MSANTNEIIRILSDAADRDARVSAQKEKLLSMLNRPHDDEHLLFLFIKWLYLMGYDWNEAAMRPAWGGYEPEKMADVLKVFAPYILMSYSAWFLLAKTGPYRVTCINDEGIRLVTLPNEHVSYDWVHTDEIVKWGFFKQPPILF